MRYDARDNIWSLSSAELAEQCRAIATSQPPPDQKIREEAERLCTEWRTVIRLPNQEFGDRSRRASLIAALRRRTIEIVVKTRSQTLRPQA